MPRQVRAAARLMYAGALLSATGLLYYSFSTSPSATPQPGHVGDPYTTSYRLGWFIGTITDATIVAGLWLWMAWAVKRGRAWARIVSVVLFCLGTLRLLSNLILNPVSVVTISWALSWLAGLGAVILFFQRPSSAFFAARGTQAYLPSDPAGQYHAPPNSQTPQPRTIRRPELNNGTS